MPRSSDPPRSRHRLPLAAALVLLSPCSAAAQGLPSYRPINPAVASRSALGFQPFETGAGWRTELLLDYASLVEMNTRPNASYLLDAEVPRLELGITRGLGARWFVQARIPVQAAQAGFLDKPINWWHRVFGFSELKRDSRPNNVFDYHHVLPDSTVVEAPPMGFSPGDLRAAVGLRHSPHWQTILTVALPTATGPEAYRLGTIAAGVVTTVRSDLIENRTRLEASLGLGYTPRHGVLAEWQRTSFASASGGLRVRVVGQQAAFFNVLFHTAPYRGTAITSLDRPDLSLDFGFLFDTGGGPEIVASLVEDLYPYGASVDLVLRLGVRW